MWSTNGKTGRFRVSELVGEGSQRPGQATGSVPESAWLELADGRKVLVGFVYVKKAPERVVYAFPRHLQDGEPIRTFATAEEARACLRQRCERLISAGAWPDR
jgi:hypothetical protein